MQSGYKIKHKSGDKSRIAFILEMNWFKYNPVKMNTTD